MNREENILLAFYGDDLTGSTDALEFICRAGARAILFLDVPGEAQLRSFPGLQAYGIAGLTRSLPAGEMEKHLFPAFRFMQSSGAKHVHYKVCSTFDSSAETGSIGKAIDCGAIVFQNHPIPVIGGMPALGRYCVFGNLFARMGTGSNGKIYRLDRHPSVSRHPVTPAHESDLRIHLGSQTNKSIGLVDIMDLKKDPKYWMDHLQNEEVVLVDALEEEQLLLTGEWLHTIANGNRSLFSIGSSVIELALGKYWQQKGILIEKKDWKKMEKTGPLLVISGSCSPVTAAQIEYAVSEGFEEVVIDMAKEELKREQYLHTTIELLREQKNVIVHTGKKQSSSLSSECVGNALGSIAVKAIENLGVKRVVIAGGDTSSYAARAMGIEALEMISPFVTGAPLCKVYSKNKSINGIEVNLKGGQVGEENYFQLLTGEQNSSNRLNKQIQ